MNFNRKTTDLKSRYNNKTDPHRFISPNATVWVRLPEPDETLSLYRKALVISIDQIKNTVKIRILETPASGSPEIKKSRNYEEYNVKDVFKVNSLYRPQGYDDLMRMVVVNEAEIIWNFKTRFFQSLHYNYISPFLIFLNSTNIPAGLFSRTNISFYRKMVQNEEALNSRDFLPHIYGEISEALKALKTRHQAILFHGETNAGKSLNFSRAVEFLSVLNKESKENKGLGEFLDLSDSLHFDIYEELLYSSSLLIEAFTSARTKYAPQSSRAVRSVCFVFEKKTLVIRGASVRVDFLEVERVGFRPPDESNFLIFYYLLHPGSSDSEKCIKQLKAYLKNKTPPSFAALAVEGPTSLPDLIPGKDYYKELRDSLQMIGLNHEEISSIFKLLAAIILLAEPLAKETNQLIAEMLGFPATMIPKFLDSPHSDRKIAMVWLYKRLYKWVVGRINQAFLSQIDPGKPISENYSLFQAISQVKTFPDSNPITNSYALLHLIDPPGVKTRSISNVKPENMPFSGLFELEMNYFFEKIQQIYLKETFKDEEVSFLQEGLIKSCDFIDFKDNLPVIELLEKPNHGILGFFEEQISGFLEKKGQFKLLEEKSLEEIMARDTNDVFFTGKMTKKARSFVIIHSFNEVYYSVESIAEHFNRNYSKSQLIPDVKQELLANANKLLGLIINNSRGRESGLQNYNFMARFRNKMERVIETIANCEKRFVFCIGCEKSNTSNYSKPLFNSLSCLNQAHIFELNNLIIRFKDEFAIKLDFSAFYNEFKELLGTSSEVFMKEKVLDLKHLCDKIVNSQFPEAMNSKVLIGKSKIYLKAEVYQKLQTKRALSLNKKNSIKQDKFFASPQFKVNLKLSIHGLKQVMKVIIEFQKRFRARLMRKRFLRKKKALTQIFCSHERATLKHYFKKYRSQVTSLTLKSQKLKQTIRLMQISRNSFMRGYFRRYRETVQYEKLYFSKKTNNSVLETTRNPNQQRPSQIIQADVILAQIERQKTIDSKKNSLIMSQPPPLQREELSLGKLLKNKLLKSLENKSIFNRLTKKKTNESSSNSLKNSAFSLDESSSLEPNPLFFEESKTTENMPISEKAESEEMASSVDLDQKRRKCVTAKSFLEYENKSTKSLLEDYLVQYKLKKEPLFVDFEQLSLSNDVYLDFEMLDRRFIEELKREYFEETWRKIIIERTVWGQKQKYAKLMSFQAKMLDNALLDLPSKFKDLAKRMFKYVLQYSDDRKCKFPKAVQLNKFINLLMAENNRSFLQDEVYLQILKQLSNNPSKVSTAHLMNLLAIVSSLIPPSSNIVLSVLNFLYLKAQLNLNFNEELARKCKYIFIRVSKIFEIGARKHVPMDSEIACIESSRQILYPVFFLTGEHVLVVCESYTLIREMRLFIASKFKIPNHRIPYLGIYYVVKAEKENSFSTEEEGFLDDKGKIMDILARWENIKKINLKSDFSFNSKLFLKVRVCFDYEASNSNDDITLVYIQSVFEFLNDKFILNEKEILSLAAAKMAVDYGDFSEENVRFLKINIQDYIPKSKLENYQPQVWIDRILVNYLTLKTYGKTQAKQLFMSYLKKFEHFNAHIYRGKLVINEEIMQGGSASNEGSLKILICKSNELAIGEDTNKVNERLKFTEIGKWGRINKKGVYFSRENEEKKVYNFFTDKYKDLEFIFKFYTKNT